MNKKLLIQSHTKMSWLSIDIPDFCCVCHENDPIYFVVVDTVSQIVEFNGIFIYSYCHRCGKVCIENGNDITKISYNREELMMFMVHHS